MKYRNIRNIFYLVLKYHEYLFHWMTGEGNLWQSAYRIQQTIYYIVVLSVYFRHRKFSR